MALFLTSCLMNKKNENGGGGASNWRGDELTQWSKTASGGGTQKVRPNNEDIRGGLPQKVHRKSLANDGA